MTDFIIEEETRKRIMYLAEKYETKDFLPADPSSFMHKVEGKANMEAMAFIASCLSYGSRKQFFPKIQFLLDDARGDVGKPVFPTPPTAITGCTPVTTCAVCYRHIKRC